MYNIKFDVIHGRNAESRTYTSLLSISSDGFQTAVILYDTSTCSAEAFPRAPLAKATDEENVGGISSSARTERGIAKVNGNDC